MFTITVPGLSDLVRELRKTGIVWKDTMRAIEITAELAMQEWRKNARNPEQTHAKWFGGQYAEAIDYKEKNLENLRIVIGPRGKGVGAAKIVEEGREKYDMKPALTGSPRARSGKDGPFTIIGFQHGMKTLKKVGIYEEFKKLKPMQKTGSKTELNAQGNTVSRNVYTMGSDGFGTRIGSTNDNVREKHLDGLMKTRQEVGRHRPSKKYQDQAVTFRVVSVNSPDSSWWYPKIEPENIKERTVNSLKDRSMKLIHAAVKKDLVEHAEKLKKRVS